MTQTAKTNDLDETTHLAEKLGKYLVSKKWHIAVAESCTGGGIAEAITRIPGSSQWFEGGFVAYSNRYKESILNVPSDVLYFQGAVSKGTVKAMVEGALKCTKVEVALAVTGILGPSGGSLINPVGTVYFGWSTPLTEAVQVQHFQFNGDRLSIREQVINQGLQLLLPDGFRAKK